MPNAARRSPTPTPAQRLREGVDRSREPRARPPRRQSDLLEIAGRARSAAKRSSARPIAEIAAARGADPVDVLIDVVLPTACRSRWCSRRSCRRSAAPTKAGTCAAGLWRDDRTVLGGSDAGAHIDLMCHANYTDRGAGESVRERKLLTLEEAVYQLADVPARLYGFRERGRVADGWHADLVVFDPDTVGTGPTVAVDDLPGGGERLYQRGAGHRARVRQRTRGDRRRRGHRRPPRHLVAVGCRHRDRQRARRVIAKIRGSEMPERRSDREATGRVRDRREPGDRQGVRDRARRSRASTSPSPHARCRKAKRASTRRRSRHPTRRRCPGSLTAPPTSIRAAGRDALMVPADLHNRASLGAAAATVLERWGRVDVSCTTRATSAPATWTASSTRRSSCSRSTSRRT